MNCGFEALVSELPDRLMSVEVLVHEAGIEKGMIERLHAGGLRRVPVDCDRPLPGFINQAVRRLARAVPDLASRTRAIVFAHSAKHLAPAEISFFGECLRHTGLSEVPRIAIGGQPCAVLHLAIQLSDGWLSDLPDGCGVVVLGGDKVYTADDRIFFNSTMGDAVVAGFLTREAKQHRILAALSRALIIAAHGEYSSPGAITRFRQLNPTLIRAAIEECLAQASVGLDDLRYIVPHTPYNGIWDTVAKLLRIPRERILTDYLHETGHLNSNDSFVHYVRAVEDGRISTGDLNLLVNCGFGGTRGCTLIQR